MLFNEEKVWDDDGGGISLLTKLEKLSGVISTELCLERVAIELLLPFVYDQRSREANFFKRLSRADDKTAKFVEMPVYRSQDAMERLFRSPTIHHLRGHTALVSSVKFNHDGTRLAAGSFDKTTRIWDVERIITAGSSYATTGDARNRSSSSKISTLPNIVLQSHTEAVYRIAWHPKEDLLATASLDKTMRIWDIRGMND